MSETTTEPTNTTPTQEASKASADPKPSEVTPENTPPPSWRESLSEDVKKSESFKSLEKIKDVDNLALSYINAEKRLGKSVSIPDKEDSEGWSKIYEKLGRPEKPEEYDLSGIENADKLDGSDPLISNFKEWAHGYGLNNRQASGLVDKFLSMSSEMNSKMQEGMASDEKELRKEFGNHFDERTALANETLKSLVERGNGNWDRVSKALEETGMANQPDLVKALSAMGHMMRQDRLWGSGGEPNTMGGQSLTELRAERAKIKSEFMDDIVRGTKLGKEKQKLLDEKLDQIGRLQRQQQ